MRSPTARLLARAALLALAVAVGAGAASAQAAGYRAVTPTKGALTTDGWTNRYLLDGGWLYRADPSGVGVARKFWRNAASTAGWIPVAVPNSDNAG
ncbi:MAG TPA: hypothetical protein VG186_16930, partial [Solirubrobacteraceae bacterium]|nr:hypothetical protein [Solirubrobacteraceae bacterium]